MNLYMQWLYSVHYFWKKKDLKHTIILIIYNSEYLKVLGVWTWIEPTYEWDLLTHVDQLISKSRFLLSKWAPTKLLNIYGPLTGTWSTRQSNALLLLLIRKKWKSGSDTLSFFSNILSSWGVNKFIWLSDTIKNIYVPFSRK